MRSLNDRIYDYGEQVKTGEIREAYQGIMNFMAQLRIYFKNKYRSHHTSSNLYPGQMDITFFAVTPKLLHDNGLKIMIMYIHEKTSFELWLVGRNQVIQNEFRQLLKENDTHNYTLSPTADGIRSIIEICIDEHPDFEYQEELIKKIDERVVRFVEDIEKLVR